MRKRIWVIFFALAVTVWSFPDAHAVSDYLTLFNARYGTSGTALNSCSVCHTSVPTLNAYGTAYMNSGYNFATIESADSDRDTFTNIVEINARTFPGNSASRPVVGDATPPTVTAFTVPSTSTTLAVSITTFTASDNVAVTGYMVTESATKPTATATGWAATRPASYAFTAAGAKTLYAWAKDAAGNVSTSRSASVTITLPPTADATPPTVSAFAVPSTSTALAVSITTFTASDNVAVTGYMVTESATKPAATATGWAATRPASYAFTAAGAKTLYAWARDAAGNVSTSRSASVSITAPSTADKTLPQITVFTIPATSSSLKVPITAFAATDNVGVTGYKLTRSSTKPSASSLNWSEKPPASYLFTTVGTKTLYAWTKDAAGNVSAGKSAKFTITAQGNTDDIMTFWIGKWFRVTERNVGFLVGSPGLEKDSVYFVGYLKIWGWDPKENALMVDRYEEDTSSGEWVSESLTLNYVGGSLLNFICWSEIIDRETNSTSAFTIRILGSEQYGVLTAAFRTLGGYYVMKNDHSNPPEYGAGRVIITGSMIPESKVPVPTNVLRH
jgi:hypothetical protein